MKKIILLVMISFSLFLFSSCIKVVTMYDIELVLIDEEFSIFEYPDSPIYQLNQVLDDYCLCQVSRVIEGKINQVSEVYIFEFEKRSQAVDFVNIVENNEFIEVIDFKYSIRYGNIVILASRQDVLELFQGI